MKSALYFSVFNILDLLGLASKHVSLKYSLINDDVFWTTFVTQQSVLCYSQSSICCDIHREIMYETSLFS